MVFNDGDELLSIPFKVVAFTVAGLPLSALFLCVVISMMLHWDEATRTHCGVPNLFPSVSAAVASYSPERYIWRLFIGIHGAPRLVLAFAFRNLLVSSPLQPFPPKRWFNTACNFACAINLLENLFLLLLTSISSVEDYEWHKACFIGFLVCSLTFMALSTWLFSYSGRRRINIMGETSFNYKMTCGLAETISLICALYFFHRHNTFCEPFVYSMFALSEYAVVVFNVLFHLTAYYDFHSKRLTLLSLSGSAQYERLPLHNYEEKRT